MTTHPEPAPATSRPRLATAGARTYRDQLALLTAHADLPGAERVLDPRRLSELLGREVVLDRVRIKPGAAVLAAHRAVPPPADPTGVPHATPASPPPAPASPPPAPASPPPAPRSAVTFLASSTRHASFLTARPREPRSDGAGTAGGDGEIGTGPGLALGDVGWVQLVASRDKRDNALRRAARTGVQITEHRTGRREPSLLSGGVDSDPRLGREVHRVLRHLPDGPAPRVLSYNPGRHLLLALPATGEVLRVAARPLDDLLCTSALWEQLGMPVMPQHHWRNRSEVLVSEAWGRGDLAALAEDPEAPAAAAALGHALAQLHTADLREAREHTALPPARIGERVPSATAVLLDLLPHRAEQVQQLMDRLDRTLPPVAAAPGGLEAPDGPEASGEPAAPGGHEHPGTAPLSLIHGDLTPDQVLLGAGAQQIRVVDLDRSGIGPRGADLGSWIASGLVDGTAQLTAPFLTAYAEHAELPGPVELAAWTARALLAAALDPMRRHHPDWPRRVEQRLDLARTVLEAATDEDLPALARALGEHPGAVVVSHRPGKRAVLRTQGTDGSTRYVKIANPGRTERALRAIERAAAFDGPFRTPQVLAADRESLTFSTVPGRPLHDGLPTADGSWQRAWEATMGAWADAVRASRAQLSARTVATAGTPAPGAPTAAALDLHGPAEEIAVLRSWQERAAAVDAEGAADRGRAVEIACALFDRLPAVDRPALIHRDLHDKQILWHEDLGPALLDVDTATHGDPALDAGNLRAHASWRGRQGLWMPEQVAQVRQQIDRAARALGIPAAVLDTYEIGTFARLTCVYALRPRWRTTATDLARSLRTASPTPL